MNVVNTVLKSVVGTLDLSIRHLLHGEVFPGVKYVLIDEIPAVDP